MSQRKEPLQSAGKRPQVVIVGAGFGGINAARALGNLPVDVTVIDRRNHHTFQPLLYQVALAVLSPAEIAQPIRGILAKNQNTEVLMDEVTGIDTQGRAIDLASGDRIKYDYLILATGATHSYFGKDDWAKLAPGLKSIEDATEMRRRILLAFELAERHMQEHGWHPPLNFVVIGGGPTGVELAGAIGDISREYLKHDFRHIDPAKSRVILLDGGESVLGTYPPELSARAGEALARHGVEVRTRNRVTNVGPGWVETQNAKGTERIPAVVTLWAAGVQASSLGKLLGTPLDRRGCVIVDGEMNPPGLEDVFVIGDLAHFEQDGAQIPGVAQPAIQMGQHAARLIEADLEGKPRTPFHYFDKGDMATIGRLAAVANVKWPFKSKMSGFSAWIAWLLIHVYFIIGFRNRLSVLWSWVWTYFTFSRSARLITGDTHLPGWEEQIAAGNAQMGAEGAVAAQHVPPHA